MDSGMSAMLLSLFFLVADAASPAGSVAKAPESPAGAVAKAPASAPPSSKYSVEEACKHTAGHYDLCVATLSSAAPKTGDTAGMARVAILAAQQNASETATFLSSIYDDSNLENKTAQLQQCLEDCGERYEAAVEQLTDATTALDTGAYGESEALVAASQAEVKLCQRGCKAVPDHRNVLTMRNREVDRLCSIALTITKLIRGPPS